MAGSDITSNVTDSAHALPTRGTLGDRTGAGIRAAFIAFFRDLHAHDFVPSSPCVPVDDPTLLFANAGMNQFKPAFLGQVEPGSVLDGVKRAVNSQKCIRAGGKHNDLDDVGKDTYHHTFFEMLGNWSFGDFFKDEIIAWAWDFLTTVCGLDPERLYATYFEGDDAQGLAPDTQARDFWLRFLPEDRVLPGDAKDNFWEMGDTGPCGPCSELHYDGRPESARQAVPGRMLVNHDDPDVIECWNLVFIQYDRQQDGSLKPLPARHVDTGMGLERIVRVVQGKRSNYDTDLFTPIFAAIERVTGAPRPYMGKVGAADTDGVDMAYRVVADHVRTLTFAIADGATPGNEGRGYVLRRVLRRAVRYGRQKLGAPEGFLSRVVPVVVSSMGDAFPELKAGGHRVVEVVLDEEQSFGKTLDRGIKQFDEFATGSASISGEDAFKLYDTFGFPLDLTQLMAEERGLTVDVAGFERAMDEQKARSRAGAKGGVGDEMALDPDAIAQLGTMGIKPTDDTPKHSDVQVSAQIKAVWFRGQWHTQLDHRNTLERRVGVVLNRTGFYAEAGGQMADSGRLIEPGESAECAGFRVEDVRSFGGYILHIGRLEKGDLKIGETLHQHRDRAKRLSTASNHTATHLMNLGLKSVLGEHVDQKGSLVAPDRLRFDFAHTKPVDPEELAKVESIVREWIGRDGPVSTKVVPLAQAQQITGLRAVFGERYPDPVRVVCVGHEMDELLADPTNHRWASVSTEFCGGTHLKNTGQAGAFAIVSEEGVAKGVRRVTALTGAAAAAAIEAARNLRGALVELHDKAAAMSLEDLEQAVQSQNGLLDELTLPAAEKARLRDRLSAIQEVAKGKRKGMAKELAAQAVGQARDVAETARDAGDRVIVATLDIGGDRAAMQAALKVMQDTCPNAAVMLLSADHSEGKAAVMAGVPKPLIDAGLKAGDWVRETVGVLGGKGGGRPDSAQGGGPEIDKLIQAAQRARGFAAESLN